MGDECAIGVAPIHDRPQRALSLPFGIHGVSQGVQAIRSNLGQGHFAFGLSEPGACLFISIAAGLLGCGGMHKVDRDHPGHPVVGCTGHGYLQKALRLDKVDMKRRPQRIAGVLDPICIAPAFTQTRIIQGRHQRFRWAESARQALPDGTKQLLWLDTVG